MKQFFSFFLLVFLLIGISSPVFWEWEYGKLSQSCSYAWEFQQCLWANKNGTTRTIEDFVCIPSQNHYDIMGQIILDVEFKKIDKEIESFFESFEENKDYYFWKNAQKPFTDGVDLIENIFSKYGEYGQKYLEICRTTSKKWVLQQTMECFWWAIPNQKSSNYFFDETTCGKLVDTKLSINKKVAYDVLKLNKLQVQKDEDKKYFQKERSMYDELLEIVMINIWYIERIWKKWPSKTKNPHQ